MRIPSQYRAEALWSFLLIAILAAALWGPVAARAATDTWSAGPRGKRAFFTLTQRLLPDVRRHSERLEPPVSVGTLCVLGPARYPDAAEWRKLHDWVRAGHVLVFAAGPEDPAVDLGPFGLRVRTDPPAVPARGPDPPLQIDEGLLRAPSIRWRSPGWVEGAREDAWVAARFRGRPVIVMQREGRGLVAAAASDEIFDNVGLLNPEVALLAFRLVERARSSGTIAFDESLNESGPPRIVGLLLDQPLHALTMQVLALAAVFAWMGSRRFGAALTAEPVSRRLMTEHAAALGDLCHQAGAGQTLVASYVEYFRRELGLIHGPRGGSSDAERLARRARMDGKVVVRTLGLAAEITAAGAASNHGAAEAVEALARLKEQARHPA